MRHFYIDPSMVVMPLVTIEGADVHHIRDVLRLKPGDGIKLFDGTGFEYEAVILELSASNIAVRIQRKIRTVVRTGARIIVAQSFLKEKKMDDIVRKLCELGVAEWIPFFSQRSIAKPDKKRLDDRAQRWQRIATEAVKQCKRVDLPKIGDVLSFEEVLDFAEVCDLKIVFWENESNLLDPNIGSNREQLFNNIILMLGPEGGFTPGEIKMAQGSGFIVAGLGPRILRAETATLAACTLIQYLFGDMGPKKS